MAYFLYVTRAESVSGMDENPISAQEWLQLIEEDPELIPNPGTGEYFVTWRGTSSYPETWFNWQDGRIYTKNPDKATVEKMYQMAQRLNAQLQDDEGEAWELADIEAFVDPDPEFLASLFAKPENGFLARLKRFLKLCARQSHSEHIPN